MRGELSQYTDGIKGQVRLMSNTNALTEFPPELLSDFLAAHPDVNIGTRKPCHCAGSS